MLEGMELGSQGLDGSLVLNGGLNTSQKNDSIALWSPPTFAAEHNTPDSPQLWTPGMKSQDPKTGRSRQDLYKLYETLDTNPHADLSLRDLVERTGRKSFNSSGSLRRSQGDKTTKKEVSRADKTKELIHLADIMKITEARRFPDDEPSKAEPAVGKSSTPEASPKHKKWLSKVSPASSPRSSTGSAQSRSPTRKWPRSSPRASPRSSPRASPRSSPRRSPRKSPLASPLASPTRLQGSSPRLSKRDKSQTDSNFPPPTPMDNFSSQDSRSAEGPLLRHEDISSVEVASLPPPSPLHPAALGRSSSSEQGSKHHLLNQSKPSTEYPSPHVLSTNTCSSCSAYTLFFRTRCLVCGRIYCGSCVVDAMGTMSEGRKCKRTCLGKPLDKQYIAKAGRGCWPFGISSAAKEAELKWARRRTTKPASTRPSPRSSVASSPCRTSPRPSVSLGSRPSKI